MQSKTDKTKKRSSRGEFLGKSGAMAAGMCLAGTSAAGAAEGLALNGGKKAVTVSANDATSWPRFGDEEIEAVNAVVRHFGYGEVEAFEKDWKQHFKPPFCKSHMNGTSALTSALFALNLPPGSEILVPSLDPWFGILPMRLFGLVPVFVDNNPRTLNFDVEDARRRLTKNTRAIEVVHLFGLPCDMEAICDFAKEKGLPILEDCAHAHNASINGKYVGNWGQIGAFSCQGSTRSCRRWRGASPTTRTASTTSGRPLSATTSAPASSPATARTRNMAPAWGSNCESTLWCRPGPLPVKGLDQQTELERQQNHDLNSRVCQLPGLSEPTLPSGVKRVYWRWNILFLDPAKAGMSRDTVIKALKAEGVAAGPLNYSTSHRDTAFNEPEWWHHAPVIPDRLPGLEEALETGISLPRFTKPVPELIDQYVAAFEKVWAHRAELGKA